MRFLVAIPASSVLSLAGVLLSVAVAGASNEPPAILKAHPELFAWLLWAALVIVFVQALSGYLQVKLDIDKIEKHDESFFRAKRHDRYTASNIILDVYRETDKKQKIALSENTKIEPVLDFFEDIGLLVDGNRLSDTLVHHYFFHWLTIYAEPIHGYLALLYTEKKAEYKYLLRLYDRMRAFERLERGYFHIVPSFRRLEPLKEQYILDEINDTRARPSRKLLQEGNVLLHALSDAVYADAEGRNNKVNAMRNWLYVNRPAFSQEDFIIINSGIAGASQHQYNIRNDQNPAGLEAFQKADTLLVEKLRAVEEE